MADACWPRGYSYYHLIDQLYERPSIRAAIRTIQRRWPNLASTSTDDPCFIFASSWRSGSTLLQRMLSSQRLIWGEPYSDVWPVQDLAETLTAISASWPPKENIFEAGQKHEKKAPTSCSPSHQELLAGHLAFFRRLFAEPARANGAKGWGIKEVRWSAEIAFYLRWLFPKSTFLFLVRNPYDALRSYLAYREATGDWYVRCPQLTLGVREFGRHWRTLTQSFLNHYREVGGLYIDYDALVARRIVPLLRSYLSFPIDPSQYEKRPPGTGPSPIEQIDPHDLDVFRSEVEPLAGEMGYFAKELDSKKKVQSSQPTSAVATERRVPNNKCAILVPSTTMVTPHCERTLEALQSKGFEVRRLFGVHSIDVARNILATQALDDGLEEMIWVDSDTEFSVDAIESLRSHGLPVVTGVVAKKGERSFACNFPPSTGLVEFGGSGGLYKVNQVGAAFILVRRCVFKDLISHYKMKRVSTVNGLSFYPFYIPTVVPWRNANWYMGEDFAFIYRVRSLGYRVFADTRMRLGHLGLYPYAWEDVGSPIQRTDRYTMNFNG